jgi:hypothetical protein
VHLVYRVIMCILFVDVQMLHPPFVAVPHRLFPHCFIAKDMNTNPHVVCSVFKVFLGHLTRQIRMPQGGINVDEFCSNSSPYHIAEMCIVLVKGCKECGLVRILNTAAQQSGVRGSGAGVWRRSLHAHGCGDGHGAIRAARKRICSGSPLLAPQ